MVADLQMLIGLFYQAPEELGRFEEVVASEVPAVYRQLLEHENHMTVTVEAFHGSLVDVHVLKTLLTDTHYARTIYLTRRSDNAPVLFGIPRVNLAYLDREVRDKIESQSAPLGRILIEHNVLREIRLLSLWRVTLGKELQKIFGLSGPAVSYGRSAVIDCNGQPAVELLEIVPPVP